MGIHSYKYGSPLHLRPDPVFTFSTPAVRVVLSKEKQSFMVSAVSICVLT